VLLLCVLFCVKLPFVTFIKEFHDDDEWKTETGRQYVQILEVYIQPLWRIWPAKQTNSVKNAKKAITPFKVIKVGTNEKAVCDFLLVINSN